MKRIFLLLFTVVLCPAGLLAQQGPLMSHYMFNGLLLNPAYAGSKEFVSTTLLYRKQWTGFEGAPVTYSGTIHGLFKKKRLGWGALVQQDEIGVTRQTDVYGVLSYHLPMGDARLSVGLQAGFSNFSSRLAGLKYWDRDDAVFPQQSTSDLLPNAGFGAYYYRERFYAGLSAPMLISYDPYDGASLETNIPVFRQVRRFYLNAGGIIETQKDIKLKPSVLVRAEPGSDIQFDLNMNVLFNDIFWVGASYRSNESIVALFEYQVSRKFRIGYSYDYTFGLLGSFNSGSHEVMLGYDFGFPVTKMKSPRYF